MAVARGGYDTNKIAGWIWDVAERKQTVELDYSTSQLTWLGWNAKGGLAAATNGAWVVLFDTQSGKCSSQSYQMMSLFSASWSPDGRHIADSSGRIVDLGKKGLIDSNLTGRFVDGRVAWSPDGKRLASSDGGKTVRLWTAEGRAGPVLEGHEGMVFSIAWKPDSKRLASASADFTVRTWKADGAVDAVLRGHESEVYAVAWRSDGKGLVSGSGDKTIHLWREDGTPGPVLKGHTWPINAVGWNRDDSWLASVCGGDQTVRLWHPDGTPGPVLRGHTTQGARFLAWRPDGKQLASSGDYSDYTIRMWATDGTPGRILRPSVWVGDIAWKPDGEWLASAEEDGSVRLWAADGSPGPSFKRHGGTVSSVAWSPDGKHLASLGRDRALQVSSDKGEPEWTVVFLPNGRAATLSAAGELLQGDSEVIEEELVYLVEQTDGRIEVLRPAAFREHIKAAEKAAGR